MFREKKRILILGGEGFIGRNLVDSLSKDFDCYSVDRSKSIFVDASRIFIGKNPYKRKIKNNYDVIIHLIDNKIDEEFYENEELALIKNLNINNSNHLVLFSSAVIYANPDSEYGKRKIKMEKLYTDYCKENNINLTIFRLFNIYGSYHLSKRQGSLVANIFLNYLNGKETEINDMNACRDFIFAKDLGKFIEYAIENYQYGIINLTTGNPMPVSKLLAVIEKIVGEKLPIKDKKNKENIVCPQVKNKLIDRIKIISLERGLRETFNFYKKNLDAVNKCNK